jgi:hypothetical protein
LVGESLSLARFVAPDLVYSYLNHNTAKPALRQSKPCPGRRASEPDKAPIPGVFVGISPKKNCELMAFSADEANPIIELLSAECYSVRRVVSRPTQLGPTFRYRLSWAYLNWRSQRERRKSTNLNVYDETARLL